MQAPEMMSDYVVLFVLFELCSSSADFQRYISLTCPIPLKNGLKKIALKLGGHSANV